MFPLAIQMDLILIILLYVEWYNEKERLSILRLIEEIKESSLLDEHYINTTKFNVLNFESFLVLGTKVINNSEKLIYKLHFQEFIYVKSFYEVIFLDLIKKICIKIKKYV